MGVLQVIVELLLQRLRRFLMGGAMTPERRLELHIRTRGTFRFYRNGPQPFGAAESGLLGWHGFATKEYTASLPDFSSLDFRQEWLALLPRNASFIITKVERE